MFLRYNSTADLRRAYLQIKPKLDAGHYNSYESDKWFGNESEADTLRYAETGRTSLVPNAEKLLDQLDQVIETPRRVWDRSPAGAFCSVPDYVVGLPTPMRRQVHIADESAPITILAATTCSAGIDAKTMEKRGTVILALVMALTRVRPVALHQLTTLHGEDNGETIITSEINTSPLDLATACYVLTSVGFARRLTYGLGKALNEFNGSWPRRYRYSGNNDAYYRYIANNVAADPKRALVIAPAELHDELLRQPLVWINKQIARFTTEQEEELV